MDNVLQMMQYVREAWPGATISLEVEALRHDWAMAKQYAVFHSDLKQILKLYSLALSVDPQISSTRRLRVHLEGLYS